MKKYAKWTRKYINELPNSAFAVVNSDGRYLPHHNNTVKSGDENKSVDIPHLKNALSRLSQTKISAAEKSRAKSHLEKHARALLPSYSKNNMFRFFSKDSKNESENAYKFKGNIIEGVEIFRTGVFRNKLFDEKYINDVANNFHELRGNDIFRNVPVRVNHQDWLMVRNAMKEVAGYISNVYVKDTGNKIEVTLFNEDDEKEVMKINDVRLVCDMEITDNEVFKKIQETTFRDRSSELGQFADNNGNVYEPVLWGVAFVDIPQVDKLNALFSKDNDSEITELNRDEFVTVDLGKKKKGNCSSKAKETMVNNTDDSEIIRLKNELEVYKNKELNDKIELFVKDGKSTIAMNNLEKQLITSIFAEKGSPLYKTPQEIFKIYLDIKESTPKLWEKKDSVITDADAEIKKQGKEAFNLKDQNDAIAAKELLKQANIKNENV